MPRPPPRDPCRALCFPCLGWFFLFFLFLFPSPTTNVKFAIRCRSPVGPSADEHRTPPPFTPALCHRSPGVHVSARCLAGNVSQILKCLLTFTCSCKMGEQLPPTPQDPGGEAGGDALNIHGGEGGRKKPYNRFVTKFSLKY